MAVVLLVALVAATVPGCRAFEPDFGRFDVPEVRPLRDRAAQHDALVELRLQELLPVAMARAGIDCWLVRTSTTAAPGRVVLSFCRRDSAVVRRAWGRGLRAVEGLYETETETASTLDADPGALLRAELESHEPAAIAVNRSPDEPWADGLAATDAAWLEETLGPTLWGRTGSASELVQGFLGRHLEAEEALFTEAARLNDAILHEVLSDREVVAAGTSLVDLRWAFHRRSGRRDVEVAVEPRTEIWRRGQALEAETRTEQDLLLQPGDLVFLTAGIRYLDYAVPMGRWAYLLPEGELAPPGWVPAALEERAGDLEAAVALLAPGAPGDRLAASLRELAGARELRTLRVGRLGRMFDLRAAGTAPGTLPWSLEPPLPGPGPLVLELSGVVRPPGWEDQEIELTLREAVWVGPDGGRPVIPIQRAPYLID